MIRNEKLARDRGMGEGGAGGRDGGRRGTLCMLHGMDDLPDCVSTAPPPHVMGFFCDEM